MPLFGEGGVLDALGKVLIKYQVDVSAAKAGLKELDGAQRAQAEAEIKRQQEINAKLTGVAKGIENVNVYVKALKIGWEFAADAVASYAKKFPDDDRLKSWNSGVQAFGEAWENVKATVGSIALILAPVVEELGKAAKWASDLLSSGRMVDLANGRFINGQFVPNMSAAEFARSMAQASENEADRSGRLGGVSGRSVVGYDEYEAEIIQRRVARGKEIRAQEEKAAKELKAILAALDKQLALDWQEIAKAVRSEREMLAELARQGQFGLLPSAGGAAGIAPLNLGLGPPPLGGSLAAVAGLGGGARDSGFRRISGEDRLEAMFGPIENINLYQMAFQGLSDTLVASFQAWATGAESVSAAFKRVAASSLIAGGTQLLGQAILHGVYAIGDLAFGDVRGAALHGIAAAKAGAGAVAMLGLGRAIGGGGGATAGAGASGGAGFAPSPSRSEEQGARIVVLGSYWEDDDPRRRTARIRGAIDRAERLGSSDTVRYG